MGGIYDILDGLDEYSEEWDIDMGLEDIKIQYRDVVKNTVDDIEE